VYVAKCSGDTDSQEQEMPHFHRVMEEQIERQTAGILEDQHGAALGLHQREGPDYEGGIQLGPQIVFFLQSAQTG
jgi:hypothetical protein